jgi:galactose mutarotase-like enzyme
MFAPVCVSYLQGYPGTLDVSVRYELLSHRAELRITISAVTDKPTPGEAADV